MPTVLAKTNYADVNDSMFVSFFLLQNDSSQRYQLII